MLAHCLIRWLHMKHNWIYVFELPNVKVVERVQVRRVTSHKGPLLTGQEFLSCASPDMYIIEPTSIHIVIQKILIKSGRTTVYS